MTQPYNDSIDNLEESAKILRQLKLQRSAAVKQQIDEFFNAQTQPKNTWEELSALIRKKQVEIMQKISSLSSRINYSNQLVSKLLTEFLHDDKWLIVEGSDIWQDMDKRCHVSGLYAINKKNKYFSTFHRNFKTQTRQLYIPSKTQYDECYVRKVPLKCKTTADGHFYVLAESSINSSAENTFNLFRKASMNANKPFSQIKRDFKQFTDNLDNEFIEEMKKSFIETNWFEAYLIKRMNLEPEDVFYGGSCNSAVSLNDEKTCSIKKAIYNAIDNDVEELRLNSFILK